ncbi:MAG: hypothetical protein WCV73_02730 [Patescibacteria group bacterium]|jgi:hypothetical protein
MLLLICGGFHKPGKSKDQTFWGFLAFEKDRELIYTLDHLIDAFSGPLPIGIQWVHGEYSWSTRRGWVGPCKLNPAQTFVALRDDLLIPPQESMAEEVPPQESMAEEAA